MARKVMRGEGPGPRCAARKLWVRLQASARCIRYQGNARTWGSRSPGSLHGLGEPGQDLRVVSRWTPNIDIVLTSVYSKGLRMRTWKCGGGEEGGEEGGKPQSRLLLRVDCGLHYRFQWCACSIWVTHVLGGVAPGGVTRSGVGLGKIFEL